MLGCLAGLLAVAFGAFGAHALRDKLSPENLTIYQTGVQYQMYHGLALLAVGTVGSVFGQTPLLTWAGSLFTAGIALFSGSLYLLTVTGVKKLGAITPVGGVGFLAGWICLLLAGLHAFHHPVIHF
jgi:uncharacterized membrane protein YgdD (TMEM256/DUF423 family)